MAVVRAAIVENGVVVNATKCEESFAIGQGWIVGDGVKGDLWDGNTFTKPEKAGPTITRITVEQAKRAMSRKVKGKPKILRQINSLMRTLDEEDELRVSWETASHFVRDNGFISQIQAQLGLTDEDIDDLFEEAATI